MPNRARKPNQLRDLEKVFQTLRGHLPELRERYKVKSLGVFGSRVRGDQRTRSDLDVLVEFSEPPSFFEFLDLQDYLSDLSGTKVDLVMKSALKPTIGQHILQEVVPL
jgi:hypothetical protein